LLKSSLYEETIKLLLKIDIEIILYNSDNESEYFCPIFEINFKSFLMSPFSNCPIYLFQNPTNIVFSDNLYKYNKNPLNAKGIYLIISSFFVSFILI
jgi:hypothetical protein